MSVCISWYNAVETGGAAPALRNGVEVSGYLTTAEFNAEGTPFWSLATTNEFAVTVDSDCRYAIRLRPVNEENDVIYQTFDGQDTYFVRFRQAMVDARESLVGEKPVSAKINPAYISSGNYPFAYLDRQMRGNVLWLVFGVGKELREAQGQTVPLPWVPARLSLLAYGFRTDYELVPAPPWVPKTVRFVRDRKFDLPDEATEFNRPELDTIDSDATTSLWRTELRQRKTDWPEGFVAGEIICSDFTNYHGFAVPLTFRFNAFHPSWRDFSPFSPSDITNLESLARKLKEPAKEDLVSQFLWSQLDSSTKAAVLNYQGAEDPELRRDLVYELNRLTESKSLYEANRFARVKIEQWLRSLVQRGLDGRALVRYNHLLLQKAYPSDLAKPTLTQLPRLVYAGVITNVVDLARHESFHPPIIATVGLGDTRFRIRNSQKAFNEISYCLSTNDMWLSRQDARLQAQSRAGLSDMRVGRRRLPEVVLRRRIIVTAITVVSLLGASVVLYTLRRRGGPSREAR